MTHSEPLENLIDSNFKLLLDGMHSNSSILIGETELGWQIGPSESGSFLNWQYSSQRKGGFKVLHMRPRPDSSLHVELSDGTKYVVYCYHETLPKNIEYEDVKVADYKIRYSVIRRE